MEKSEGLCMDPEEAVYWCTAGTPLGEKLSAAMMTCSELGWLDNSGNWSEENMQQCMEMVMEEMAEEKVVKKCVENGKGKYSDEELAKLEELATATAGIQCFLHMFQDSCKEFVGGKVYEALYSTLVPLAG